MSRRWLSSTPSIPEVNTTQECDAVLSESLAVLFKHSPTCPVSWMAHREVSRFREGQPDVPVYLLSVRQRRDLARHIADRTGVRHESPQIIIVQEGRVTAFASHGEVTAEFLQNFC